MSAGPNGPGGPALTGVHGDVMVPAPTIPSVSTKKNTYKYFNCAMEQKEHKAICFS